MHNFELYDWRHAKLLLQRAYPKEFKQIFSILAAFRLKKSHILSPGGAKSAVTSQLDSAFYALGWQEVSFSGHKVDCYRNKVALEIDWNSKASVFDRDLSNFRAMHEQQQAAVGVIITRASALQALFDSLNVGKKYGAATTHMAKLVPMIERGAAGTCPVLALGITKDHYDPEE